MNDIGRVIFGYPIILYIAAPQTFLFFYGDDDKGFLPLKNTKKTKICVFSFLLIVNLYIYFQTGNFGDGGKYILFVYLEVKFYRNLIKIVIPAFEKIVILWGFFMAVTPKF